MPLPTVLVVEPRYPARREVADALLEEDFFVFCSVSATETLEFQRAGLSWDAIVFDIRESTEELRSYLRSVPDYAGPPLLALVRPQEDWPVHRIRSGSIHAGVTLERLSALLRDLL
jgi:hypothetical protein